MAKIVKLSEPLPSGEIYGIALTQNELEAVQSLTGWLSGLDSCSELYSETTRHRAVDRGSDDLAHTVWSDGRQLLKIYLKKRT